MLTDKIIMDLASAKNIFKQPMVIRFVAIIVAVEALVLLCLYIISAESNRLSEMFVALTTLSALSLPALYIWVVRPLIKALDEAVQAQKDAHVQIGFLSFIDPLTQLANRRQLLTHLERITSSCIRHKIYGALLLVDLNEFKSVNVLHGIDAGDAVLVEVAKRFGSSIRLEDVLCRLIGDKFVVLIDNLDKDKKIARDKVSIVAEKLISSVRVPVEYNGNFIQIEARVGVSIIEFERLTADAIIRKANVALYRAKKAGEMRVCLAD